MIWETSKPNGNTRKLLDISKATNYVWQAKTYVKDGINLTIKHFTIELNNKTIRL